MLCWSTLHCFLHDLKLLHHHKGACNVETGHTLTHCKRYHIPQQMSLQISCSMHILYTSFLRVEAALKTVLMLSLLQTLLRSSPWPDT